MKIRILFIILIFLFANHHVIARQNYPSINYQAKEGLPSNTIYDLFRDVNGRIWIATDRGISIFNGKSFVNYTTNDGLADNEIYYFQPDCYGRIWLATENGKLCYYKDGKFYNEQNDKLLQIPNLGKNTVYISHELDSSLTIYYNDKTHFINIKNRTLRIQNIEKINKTYNKYILKHIGKIADNNYELLYEDRKLFIDSFSNIIDSIAFSKKIKYHKFKNQEFFIHDNDIVKDRSGKILFRMAGETESIEAPFIYRMHYDQYNYFVSTNNGFLINSKKDFLSNYRVSCIVKDIDSNYWISTLDNGIFKIPFNFENYQEVQLPDNSPILHAFNDENQNIYYFNKMKNLFVLEKDFRQKKLFDFYEYTHQPRSFINNNFIVTGRSVIFNNTSANKKNVEIFYSPCISCPKYTFKTLEFPDNHSNTMFYNNNRIYLSSLNDILYKEFRLSDQNINRSKWQKLKRSQTIALTTLKNSFIFDSTIYLWDRKSIFKVHQDSVFEYDKIAIRTCKMLGRYLVGIDHNNKLFIYNIYNKILSKIKHPYVNSIWERLYALDSNHLLVNDYNCYFLLTLKNNNIDLNIVENPFLPQNAEFVFKIKNNCIFFKEGKILTVRYDEILKPQSPPLVHFTKILIGNKNFNSSDNIVISFGSSRKISISFEASNFHSGNVVYEYQINAGNWISTSNNEIIWYNLPSGNYRVNVRARTSVSNAYSNIACTNFVITKPYWEQWWFITALIVSVILILALITYWRIRFVLRKREMQYLNKITILRSEYKALNALMNPHFVFNALNSVQRLINLGDKSSSTKFMQILSRLIRQNMHNLDRELITLNKELDLVRNYIELEQLRFKEFLTFEIKIEEQVDVDDILIPPLLIQPLVENSIKHGRLNNENEQTYITIGIKEIEDNIIIEITDNGASPTTSSPEDHQSFGLKNIEMRMKQLKEIYKIKVSLTFQATEQSFKSTIILKNK